LANEALARLRDGRIRGAAVLVMMQGWSYDRKIGACGKEAI